MKKLFFIYNPYAGKGQIKESLSDIIDLFIRSGYEVNIRPTQGPGDARETIANLPDGYDLVVASGGDGSMNAAVEGMMARNPERRIPIGYIPKGSTNDFGGSLGISRNTMEAAEQAVNGVPFPCDMGRFNGTDIFVYVAAFGLFTDVSYQTSQESKKLLGHLAYVLEGTKRLSAIQDYHIVIDHDGESLEGDFIFGMVTNSRSVGGFGMLTNKQEVAFDDGYLEVTLIKKPRNIVEMQQLASALLVQESMTDLMVMFHTKEISFTFSEEVAWTKDGEDGGTHSKVEISVEPKAVVINLAEESIPKISIDYLAAGANKSPDIPEITGKISDDKLAVQENSYDSKPATGDENVAQN